MPYLMYCDRHVYNPDDIEDGLLESSTLFAVAKHIYQGPSTALKHDGFTRGKAGNAYVAVQARFGISSQDQWGHMDGKFSYCDFYWSIVDLLKGEEGQEIIDRFNIIQHQFLVQEVRPCRRCWPSDFEVLEAQRAAKHARKIAAAAASSAPA
ncbi:hypothetical protein DFH08DRAFT_969901 [Mycena albidolilacea]|uniref:Uncharacterized protein n=1 Tax=Mycena albidolilacea TaxID=1033008 RepID=A0AAD6ZFY0_9AGAR|nr:hypothetical protein DFH08DRAFT_969901 [Mycena albidolilacea]